MAGLWAAGPFWERTWAAHRAASRVSTFASGKRRPERPLAPSPGLSSATTPASPPAKPWVLMPQAPRP